MKFHVNPKTGNPSGCRATEKKGCPFGGEDTHFESKEAARADYEKKQADLENFLWKTKMPVQGAKVLATYDPLREEVPVGKLWDNEVFDAFAGKMADAEDGTRLVLENGQVWKRDILDGNDMWSFVSGYYDPYTSLEKNLKYDRSWLTTSIQKYGARLEKGGATPHMSPEFRLDIYPEKDEVKHEAAVIGTVFTEDDGGFTAQDLESHLDDHITERWSGLGPEQWITIKEELRKNLGEPTNLGDDDDPSWIWRK